MYAYNLPQKKKCMPIIPAILEYVLCSKASHLLFCFYVLLVVLMGPVTSFDLNKIFPSYQRKLKTVLLQLKRKIGQTFIWLHCNYG